MFEDFLQTFKAAPKPSLSSALSGMNIDEDDLSDEDDLMDDDEEAQEQRRQTRSKANEPRLKYMDILRQVSNRTADEITIDLDDLAKVSMLEYWTEPF